MASQRTLEGQWLQTRKHMAYNLLCPNSCENGSHCGACPGLTRGPAGLPPAGAKPDVGRRPIFPSFQASQ